jgi:hypothetical protein
MKPLFGFDLEGRTSRFNTEFIAGPHWTWPLKFVETSADYAACRLKVAFHQKPHGDGGSVPAAAANPRKKLSRVADWSR